MYHMRVILAPTLRKQSSIYYLAALTIRSGRISKGGRKTGSNRVTI